MIPLMHVLVTLQQQEHAPGHCALTVQADPQPTLHTPPWAPDTQMIPLAQELVVLQQHEHALGHSALSVQAAPHTEAA
jgi:hypothetical protein